MSQGNTILILGTRFIILKRQANRVLIGWTEKSSGIDKSRWICLKNTQSTIN